MLHLGEEVGELFDIYLQHIKMKDGHQTKEDVGLALNDVAADLFMICDEMKINLSESLRKEIDENQSK